MRWNKLCLVLLLCLMAGACGQREQEQREAFIALLETDLLAPSAAGGARMDGAMRKKLGNYARHFDLLVSYAKELGDIDARLNGEKARLAALGPVPMDRLGSERARIEQIVATLSRSAQHVETLRTQADAAKAALEQPEAVRTVFDRAYGEVGGYAAACLARYAVQKEFYAEALRMSLLIERHRERIQFRNNTVIIDDHAVLTEFNALQKSLREKYRHMQSQTAVQ